MNGDQRSSDLRGRCPLRGRPPQAKETATRDRNPQDDPVGLIGLVLMQISDQRARWVMAPRPFSPEQEQQLRTFLRVARQFEEHLDRIAVRAETTPGELARLVAETDLQALTSLPAGDGGA